MIIKKEEKYVMQMMGGGYVKCPPSIIRGVSTG